MLTFSEKNGFTVVDLLQFGFSHADAACFLFNEDLAFIDSAGYLAHLGVELILKAWHLQLFGKYEPTHDIVELHKKIQQEEAVACISSDSEEFLVKLQTFYELRYPRRGKGPVEVGTEDLKTFQIFLNELWNQLPDEMIKIYNQIDSIKKGGRILMKKLM